MSDDPKPVQQSLKLRSGSAAVAAAPNVEKVAMSVGMGTLKTVGALATLNPIKAAHEVLTTVLDSMEGLGGDTKMMKAAGNAAFGALSLSPTKLVQAGQGIMDETGASGQGNSAVGGAAASVTSAAGKTLDKAGTAADWGGNAAAFLLGPIGALMIKPATKAVSFATKTVGKSVEAAGQVARSVASTAEGIVSGESGGGKLGTGNTAEKGRGILGGLTEGLRGATKGMGQATSGLSKLSGALSKGGEAVDKTTAAAGSAQEGASSALGGASKAGTQGGKAAMKGGAALSKTIIGAIIGVPLAAAGALMTGAGYASKGASVGLKVTGKATKAVGKVLSMTMKLAGKAMKAVSGTLKLAGKTMNFTLKVAKVGAKPLKMVARGTRRIYRTAKTVARVTKKSYRVAKRVTTPVSGAVRLTKNLTKITLRKAKTLAHATNSLSDHASKTGKALHKGRGKDIDLQGLTGVGKAIIDPSFLGHAAKATTGEAKALKAEAKALKQDAASLKAEFGKEGGPAPAATNSQGQEGSEETSPLARTQAQARLTRAQEAVNRASRDASDPKADPQAARLRMTAAIEELGNAQAEYQALAPSPETAGRPQIREVQPPAPATTVPDLTEAAPAPQAEEAQDAAHLMERLADEGSKERAQQALHRTQLEEARRAEAQRAADIAAHERQQALQDEAADELAGQQSLRADLARDLGAWHQATARIQRRLTLSPEMA